MLNINNDEKTQWNYLLIVSYLYTYTMGKLICLHGQYLVWLEKIPLKHEKPCMHTPKISACHEMQINIFYTSYNCKIENSLWNCDHHINSNTPYVCLSKVMTNCALKRLSCTFHISLITITTFDNN